MGYCRYAFNASELYQRTKPGQAPEVLCGARTFPAVDEPEVAVVRTGMGAQGATHEYRPTGRLIARPTDDPHCPAHGGSPEPPPPPVSAAELQAAHAAYTELVARYESQLAGLTTAEQVQPPAGQLTAGDVRAAAQQIRALAQRALAESPAGPAPEDAGELAEPVPDEVTG